MASLIGGQLKLLNHFWAKYSFVIWRQPWKRARKSKYSQGHSSILHFNKDSIEIPGEDATHSASNLLLHGAVVCMAAD